MGKGKDRKTHAGPTRIRGFPARRRGAVLRPPNTAAPERESNSRKPRRRPAIYAQPSATAAATGRPAVRLVLPKAAEPRRFVFSTHPTRLDLAAHPRAALCFHGAKRERPVRIEGMVTPVPDAEADACFATRPRLSQLGARASRPSQSMGGRCEWQQAVADAAPRPANGWGYRVVPEKIEFWHQRPFRHHDRRMFVRSGAARPAPWLFP